MRQRTKPKALFFDVDGTLVDDKTKQVPQSAIAAIRQAKERGHRIFINSGRVVSMLGQVDDYIPVDGLICGCGTHIIVEGKTLYEHRVPLAEGNKIKKALLKYNISAFLEAREAVYMPAPPFSYPDMERLYRLISPICPVKLDALRDESYVFDKFCVMCDRQKQGAALEAFVKEADYFQFIDRSSHFFEFVPKGHSKGTAMVKVLEAIGISLEDTCVFGDSMNDVSMFTCGAGHRILMGEHDAGLERYASFVTARVMEDGIAYAMRHLNIIE